MDDEEAVLTLCLWTQGWIDQTDAYLAQPRSNSDYARESARWNDTVAILREVVARRDTGRPLADFIRCKLRGLA